MINRKIAIIGAGGHGKVVADVAESMGYEDIVFLDDDTTVNECGTYKCVGTSERMKELAGEGYDIFVAVGNPIMRKNIIEKAEILHINCPVLIHKSAIVSKNVTIGMGTVIMPGVIVNAGTKIGKGCILNTACSVDHDNFIGEFVHVSVGAHTAGSVMIGDSSWVGIGAIISNNVAITSNCNIGAGAVVIRDINESGTYVGVPAVKIK